MKLYFVLFLLLFSKLKFEVINGKEVRIIIYDPKMPEEFIFIKSRQSLQYCFDDTGNNSTTHILCQFYNDNNIGPEYSVNDIDNDNDDENIRVFKTELYYKKRICIYINSVKPEYDRFKVKITVTELGNDKKVFIFPGIILDDNPTITCKFMEVANDNKIVNHQCNIVAVEKASVTINTEKQLSSIKCLSTDTKIEKGLKTSKYICSSPLSRKEKKTFFTVNNYGKIVDLSSILSVDEEIISRIELEIKNSKITEEVAKEATKKAAKEIEINLKKKVNVSDTDKNKYSSILSWVYVGTIPALLLLLMFLGCFIDRKYINQRKNHLKDNFQLSKLQTQAVYVTPSNVKYKEAKKFCTSKPIFNSPIEESAKYSTSKPLSEVVEDKKSRYCTTSRVF